MALGGSRRVLRNSDPYGFLATYVISIKEFKRKANFLFEYVNNVNFEITMIKNITVTVKENYFIAWHIPPEIRLRKLTHCFE
jgi:hypothetical protein